MTACGISQFRNKVIDEILKDVDANKDGKIDYLEFLIGMGKMQQQQWLKKMKINDKDAFIDRIDWFVYY